MIKSLQLKNFQSHKDTRLKFDPGVNVIIGASDSGKTAVIRALRWLVWNRPSGDEFRSIWGGSTVVHLETDTDSLDRWKHNIENAYRLNTQTDFKAFKTDVPEEVVKALNINEINLQSQLDSPFLLSSSPGEVASHFNRIARLDQIDLGLQNVQRWIRELTQDIHYKTEQITQQKTELERFAHLDKFETEVEILETLESKRNTTYSNHKQLDGLITDIQETSHKIEVQQQILKIESTLNKVLKAFEQKQEVELKKTKLEKLIEEIYFVLEDINEYTQILSIEEGVTRVLELINDKKEIEKNKDQLFKLLRDIGSTIIRISIAENNYKTLHKQFDEVFPDVCPLCGNPK